MPRRRKLTVTGWHPDPHNPQPLYRQVYERFRQAIHNGTLRPGERLPSTRNLASQLSAARGTVDLAYSLLATHGYVVGRGAAGTFVAPGLTTALPRSPNRAASSALALPGARHEAGISPFQMGVPALDAFPRALWCRLSARRARSLTLETMVGSDPTGYAPLREAVASYLAVSRGIRCKASQVIITSGFMGALGLVTRTYLRPGDPVCFEDPGYFFARSALETAGARIIPTPVDSTGLDVAQAAQARFVYVTPAHQAPLGVSLSLPRRLALLAWAARSKAWIIEDDYDSEFRYGSRPLPALKSLDAAGHVLYVGTFSKVLLPGLRLGYLVVPETEVERLKRVCQLLQVGPPGFIQTVVADFMSEGHFGRHIKRMRTLYEERRAALASALNNVFAVELQAGGMHLIARGPTLKNDRDLVARAKAHGLAPAALSWWFADPGRAESALLLSFTNIPAADAAGVVLRLQRALKIHA